MPTAPPRTNNLVPNTAPFLAAISNRVVTLGQTLTFTASATDTDQPPQALTFTLGAGAPAGAAVNASSGFFSWTPNAAPATNSLSLIVADNGAPSLSATQTFTVNVYLPPQLGGIRLVGNQFMFSWPAPSGQKYQVEYKDDLDQTNWNTLGDFNATGNATSATNTVSGTPQRYYRIQQL